MSRNNSGKISKTVQCLVCAAGIVSVLNVGFCEPPDTSTKVISAAGTRETVPDDDAPDDLKRLIALGKVQVVYDSEPKFVKARCGWADFSVRLEQSFKYSLKKSQRNGRWHVKVTITKLEPTIELTHLIRLPSSFKSPDVWKGQILRHEFDHVAVSLDPRARMLLRYLVSHLRSVEKVLEPEEVPSNERINQIINREIELRRDAVIEVMRQNNLLLDKVGAHGLRPLPERAAFFAKLYTKEHLAELKFPYVEEALGLLESDVYERTELPFLPDDPAMSSKSR